MKISVILGGITCWALAASCTAVTAAAPDGNRFGYLGENNPYYPSRTFPKLVTPQWVGEEGVEAVVVLAIDDMRGHEKWETYLRPILQRLKQIDGRAPVSIMTCKIDPADPHLQTWLNEGVSLEVHTVDHPCPLLQGGDFAKAKSTYDRCVDLLSEIPGSQPVAFRMPCCDSLNTVSPRFYREIFNQKTERGHFLSVDSSVFNILTADDPEIPRDLALDADGHERFRKYVPKDLVKNGVTFNSFVNTIENYPYPYVINRLCWEFPCVVPSDWSAQHLQKPNNPETVRDLKAALDIVVQKQGVYNLVFHPHGWIANDQVIELIDHAVAKHGKKVKFLTFREALDRLNKNLLDGHPLRNPQGDDNGVRIVDLNQDGFVDVLFDDQASARQEPVTRLWSPRDRLWRNTKFPAKVTIAAGVEFGILEDGKNLSSVWHGNSTPDVWSFGDNGWKQAPQFSALLKSCVRAPAGPVPLRLHDIDGDGHSEILISDAEGVRILGWRPASSRWEELPYRLPVGALLVDARGRDAGLRFIDLDEDGCDDVIFSNHERYMAYLFESPEKGWSRELLSGKRGAKQPAEELPMIVRADGSDNGFFVHSRHLWWQNEETAALTDLVDRRSFAQVLGNQEPGPKPPAAALRSLQARPGFAVDLVAAEPLTRDPVAFAWGPDGKFWIVEMADYPLGIDGRGKHGGRVRFLEDTNGDGQYDRSTIFLDGIGYPTGVLPWKKGVLVTTAPDIFYAEDTDGDGRADKREVLYSGFAEGNQQHRVNGLVWGLDNWIYCANGDSGGSILSVKTGEKLDIRGRDVRIRPSDGGLDAQSGQTQFGRNRDDWGNWFGCNNSNPMYQFVLADHYLRRNPHVPAPDARVPISVNPGASPVFPLSRTLARFNDFDKANRFTSACSTIIYRDDLFGPQFAGNCFTSEPVHNLVHREVMTPQGLTFTSQRSADEQQSEFLASTDNWFRPTMIQTGPDGALWVADMYRHVIEHPQWIPPAWQKRLDLRAGHDKGRIYRVAPVGAPRRPIPRLDKLPAAELVAALESPSGWQRDTVQQLLVERQAKAAAPALQKLAAESPQPLARLHALCTLDGLDALTPPVLLQGLADEHPGVRRHAVRLCEALTERPPELVEALVKLMNDPDAQVRLQLAYTLGEIDAPQAANALGQLALQESRDKFLFAAAMSSLNAKNIDQVLRAVLAQRQRGAPNLNFIEHLLNLATAFGNEQAMVGLLTEISTPKEGKLAEWQFAALASLLDTLDNRNQSLTKLRDAGDAELKATLGQVERLFVAARKTARDPQSADAERMAAVQLLGRGLDQREADISTLAALLTPQISVELQTAAAAALGRLREERVAGILLAGWKGYGPNLRGQVLDLLLSRERWQPLVLTAMEEQRVLPVDFDAARRQRLLEHKSSEIRSRAAKLLAGTVSADRQKILGEYRITLTLTGDPARGGQLFAKACAQCHKLAGTGHEVGPDLAALTDKSPESILVAVLDPNRAVESKFLNYTAVTKAGLTYQGLLAAETGNSITLKAPEAKLQVILRTDLEELLSSAKSTMPEGLEKDLKPQDLADIISHVRANVPLPKRKEFAENSPAVVQPAADGSLNLTANTCEIYGTSIVREEKYGNLGWWSSEDDHVVWQVEVLRPGKYAVWCNWACDDNSAGNRWKLEAGENALIGAVAGTGNWETYKQAQVGELTLEPGLRRLVVRSIGKPRGAALWDLKSIKLVPTK